MQPEENAGDGSGGHGVAAVPIEIKLKQIEEMFRMCGLRPLSGDIRRHLSGDKELPAEDVAKIISAGERFAKASRSVGLKELDYLDEPAKYIEGAEPEGDSSGGEQESQTVQIEVSEEGSGEQEESGDETGDEESESEPAEEEAASGEEEEQ